MQMRLGGLMDEASDGIDCSVELKCFLGSCPLAVGLQNLVNVSIYRMGLLNSHAPALQLCCRS